MRYTKYLVLLVVLVVPAIYSQAQVAIGVQIGPDYGLYNPPPVCTYGYYPYYPYACAPYGYWGPEWFVSGAFIGAGPWYHFYYTHPTYYRRFYGGREFAYRGGFEHFHGDRGFRGEEHRVISGDRGFHGGERFRDGGRRVGSGGEFHGGRGREFHGTEGSHGRGGSDGGGRDHGGRR
jgi:hypothetical protein